MEHMKFLPSLVYSNDTSKKKKKEKRKTKENPHGEVTIIVDYIINDVLYFFFHFL